MKNLLIYLLLILNSGVLYSQTPVYYPGYPRMLDSLRTSIRDKSNVPLISDLDRDGQKEIITVTIGNVQPYYLIYVIKSDGSNFPGFPKGFNEPVKDIASGDVDGDGYLDIAIRSKNFVNVIDRFGNNLSGFPVNYVDNPQILRKFISLYDLDNDGKLEIIISIRGEYNVINFDGRIRPGWPQRITGQSIENPAIGDIDNDGFAEIIFTSFRQLSGSVDSGSINIFRHNGLAFSEYWPIYFDSLYYTSGASPTIFINKDYSDSTYICVPVNRSIISTTENELNRLTKYNIKGNILNLSYQKTFEEIGTLTMGDINNDDKIEYASGTQFGEYLTAYNNDLTIVKGWPNQGGGEFEAAALIGKFSNDLNLNVAVNTWSAIDSCGFIFAYKKNGIPLDWSPLRPIGLVEAISVADLNNDSSIELIATSSLTIDDSYLTVWTIPGIPFTYENFPWPQYGHDRYRSNQYGFIPPDEPVGIQPISRIVPDKFILYQNYPNPFNPTTTIKFDLVNSSSVKLFIYDELGKEVVTLINERLRRGTYSYFFDGSKFSSGVYFYRLVTDNNSESRKMLLIK